MKKILSVVILLAILIFVGSNQVNAYSRNENDFRGASYKARVINCNEWISLRRAPSSDSDRITTIPLGAIVTVYDGPVWGINGFYPVEYNGFKGYCLKEYLEYHSGGGAPRR